ncbi:acetoacetate--CoA ligase [soil metagenome]
MDKPLGAPSASRFAAAAMTRFRQDAQRATGRSLPDYAALHRWSVEEPAAFWELYARWAGLRFSAPPEFIMSPDPMPETTWFGGATLNYAEHLLYPTAEPDEAAPAILFLDEAGSERQLSWSELRRQVARAQKALLREGVGAGERVAAYVSNTPETVVLSLACASLGAVFSSCSPDFGFEAAQARFSQIEPKLLFAADGYAYNGRHFETLETVRRLRGATPSLEGVVLISADEGSSDFPRWDDWLDDWLDDEGTPSFTPLPFDHPLYILYSSGTTGLPKAIVHRAGGALLNHHKEQRLHADIRAGDRVLFYTTCGWMMWNWLVSALAQGATLVLYEGSPSYPTLEVLWLLADRLGVSHFGTSARFIHSCRAAGLRPKDHYAFSRLRCVLSTGSPLSPAGFAWVYGAVKDDVHLASISGGTDIVGCFALGDPTAPVYAWQIHAPGRGVALAAFDEDGKPVFDTPGELVCLEPLPSMPLRFWNDPDGRRYRSAYFGDYPGVWRHGDLIEIKTGQGVVIYGRSDATLNPGGVRIGTAEIYRPLEALPEVTEALAVGKREEEGESIWLFVVLQEGLELDKDLEKRIKQTIREGASPRHVPRRIYQVSGLPRTRSGKLVEIAVSRLVNGQSVPNREVMANPEALDEIAARL